MAARFELVDQLTRDGVVPGWLEYRHRRSHDTYVLSVTATRSDYVIASCGALAPLSQRCWSGRSGRTRRSRKGALVELVVGEVERWLDRFHHH
jgi:hypothetical protein